jgi:hypothetical protein
MTPSQDPTKQPTVGFVCCVEAGRLEGQTLLLVRSLRRFGGTLADAPIVAVAPRAGREPSEATLAALRDLGVTTIVEPLNDQHPDYGMANKWAAARWAEEHVETEILAFLDSDTIVVSDPEAFRLPPDIDIAVAPVDRKDKGSNGPDDPRDEYWMRMYELTGVTERPFVTSPSDQQRIRAYFNGGLVVTRRELRLFTEWYHDFRALFDAGHLPPEGLGFLDQLSLAPTVTRHWARARVLDWRYDYPLPHRPRLPEPARSARLEDLVHIHYHGYFAHPSFLDEVRPPLPPTSPVRDFLEQWLPLQPIKKKLPPSYGAERDAERQARQRSLRGRLRCFLGR